MLIAKSRVDTAKYGLTHPNISYYLHTTFFLFYEDDRSAAVEVPVAAVKDIVCAWGATRHLIGPNVDRANRQQAIRPRPAVIE